MSSNPWLKTITLTTGSTVYNLLTLMNLKDPGITGRCCKLALQLDIGAGGAQLLVGNDDISTTNYGAVLVAGQIVEWENAALNVINASNIYLLSTTAGVKVNVNLLEQ